MERRLRQEDVMTIEVGAHEWAGARTQSRRERHHRVDVGALRRANLHRHQCTARAQAARKSVTSSRTRSCADNRIV